MFSFLPSLSSLILDYSLRSVKWKNQNTVKRSTIRDERSDSSDDEGGTEEEGESKSEGEVEGD